MRFKITTLRTVLFALLLSTPVPAQWFNQPDPRIPLTKDGKPDLTAKAPRAPDGHPDLSGVWIRREGESTTPRYPDTGLAFTLSLIIPKNAEIPLRPAAAAVFREREAHTGGVGTRERCRTRRGT